MALTRKRCRDEALYILFHYYIIPTLFAYFFGMPTLLAFFLLCHSEIPFIMDETTDPSYNMGHSVVLTWLAPIRVLPQCRGARLSHEKSIFVRESGSARPFYVCITTLYRGALTLCTHTPGPAAHNQGSKQYSLLCHSQLELARGGGGVRPCPALVPRLALK